MTTNTIHPRRTAIMTAAGLAFVTALAAFPQTDPAQERLAREERPEPKSKIRMPIERVFNLSDLWYVQSSEKAKGAGEQISQPGYKVESWYPAAVPSTVMGTLTQNNVYPDIFMGENLKAVPTAPFEVPWWYRKEFTVPAGPGLIRARLEFDGINYRANIWLNGKKIADAGTVFGAFRRFGIDVTADVKRTERNVLAVEVIPPKKGEPIMGFVDWNPAPPDNNMGLWREVRIRAFGDVSVENPFVMTKLNLETLKEARLTVTAELQNHSDKKVEGTLEGRLDGAEFSQAVTLEPKEKRKVEVTPQSAPALVIKDPRVWWTHDLGKPELYTLALSFVAKRDKADEKAAPEPPPATVEEKPRAKGKMPAGPPQPPRGFASDTRFVRFGIREVSDYINDQGYRGFKLNGKKILIRGGGWTDDLFLDVRPKKLAAEILYARHMNLNALRLEGFWGTSEALYDLCDRTGLLLMVGWSCHW